MPDTLRTEKYAFEPFGTLGGVLAGQPFRIFPVGTYHRGSRKLDITPTRLQEFAQNVKAGLPRFRIPINLEHNPELGKHGTVSDVEFLPDGADGPGLYATKYELTDDGRKWLEAGKADAVSGEAIWTLNDGAKYQDPTTGKMHDNVLAGVALTATPFFGNEVNLFSAGEAPKRGNGYTKLRELMQQKFNEMLALVKDANGDGEPDAMHQAGALVEKFCDMAYPMPAGYSGHRLLDALEIISAMEDVRDDAGAADDIEAAKRAIKAALSKVTALYTAQIAQGVETMTTPPNEADKLKAPVSAEEFAAYKAQTEAALAAANQERETFAVKLAEERRTRRLGELTAQVDKFAYVTGDKLAEHILALEEKAPEQAAYFTALLETIDTQAATADLFKQSGSTRQAAQSETLDELAGKIVVEKFGGDQAKFSEARNLAGKQRPDLLRAYLHGAPARGED